MSSGSASHGDTRIEAYRVAQFDRMRHGYLNYTEGAYRHAVETLKWLEATYGARSAAVAEWLAGQEMVFGNHDPDTPVIPDPLPEDSDLILLEERRYQIAAAHFYAGDFAEAHALFAEMSEDPRSPYRQLAPYLQARALIRKSPLRPPKRAWFDPEPMQEARVLLEELRAKGEEHPLYLPATELWYFVLRRLDPYRLYRECSAVILDGEPEGLFERAFDDRTFGLGGARRKGQRTAAERGPDDQITDWIATLSMGSREGLAHALAMWGKTRSHAWLVAAMASAPVNDPAVPDLMRIAKGVPASAPAYLTLLYHRGRLLNGQGRYAEASAACDAAIDGLDDALPWPSRNLLLDIRMGSTQSLDDYLASSWRVPVLDRRWSAGLRPQPPRFARGARVLLNDHMPVAVLDQAARNQALPELLREELTRCACVRRVLLTARAMSEPGHDPAPGHWADILRLLENPGLHPFLGPRPIEWGIEEVDPYGRNWWCSSDPGETRSLGTGSAATPGAELRTPYPDFVDADARARAEKEREAIESLGPAPNFLCEQVIRWAEAHPDDPLVPKALHLAVRATRIGCTDENTTEYSKRAFQLLQARYPKSAWAEKTPYHY